VYDLLAPGGLALVCGYTAPHLAAQDWERIGFRILNRGCAVGKSFSILEKPKTTLVTFCAVSRRDSGDTSLICHESHPPGASCLGLGLVLPYEWLLPILHYALPTPFPSITQLGMVSALSSCFACAFLLPFAAVVTGASRGVLKRKVSPWRTSPRAQAIRGPTIMRKDSDCSVYPAGLRPLGYRRYFWGAH